jgi:hypothetical protein
MGYRDDVDYDYYAAQYFSRVYDSPEERAERLNPKPVQPQSSDDGYDAWRDENTGAFASNYDPKDWRWGSWDK